ncbi:staphylopine family metallophore export MFS transporter CntE [Paenibacillaceae bacterium WGS1546]|uniref:staphylopine family metallophore export MFS transporter CntE n=1 Tax=Cohnella sp. WGS1546 TaxID=3366810 RepID=UPI00372CF154
MRNKAFSAPFLRLYALAVLFFSANSILNVIIPLRSDALGANNGHIGLIMGAYMFTCMFFRPWAGHLIHKYGPVSVLRLLLVVNGLALVLYTFTGLEGYFAARALQGICTAFFSMALQLGIIDELPEEHRSQGLSLYSLFTYMPTIIGPLIAIGIWDWGGMNGFTIAMIAIAVITAVFGYGVPLQGATRQVGSDEERAGMLEALKDSASNRPLLLCGTIMLTLSVVFGAVTAFVPLYARDISGGHAGVYLMMQASVIVIARFALAKRIPSDGQWHPRYVGAVCLSGAAGVLLLALSAGWGPAAFYAASVLIGAAQALLYPTLTTYLTFVLPKTHRNVFIGLFIATADLGVSLGGIAMGPLADAFTYSIMYTVCVGLALSAALLAWTGIGKRRTFAEH